MARLVFAATVGYDSDLAVAEFSCGAGEVVSLSGSNGSGKTTVLETALGLVPPRRGRVRWISSAGRAAGARSLMAKTELVYVPQRVVTYDSLTIEQHAEVYFRRLGRSQLRRQLMIRWLGSCGLGYLELHRRVERLSGGERQLVGLARLANPAARVLMLDEPCVGLYPEVRSGICEYVAAGAQSGRIGVVWVDHDVEVWDQMRAAVNVKEVTLNAPRSLTPDELVA